MAELLDSFPQPPHPRTGNAVEAAKYEELLSDAVDDGRLTYQEAEALSRQARVTRLTGPQLRQLHQRAWEAMYPGTKDADWHAPCARAAPRDVSVGRRARVLRSR